MKMVKLISKLIYAYIVLLAVFTLSLISVHFIPKSAIAENIAISSKVLQEEGEYKRLLNFTPFTLDNFTDSFMLIIAATANEENPINAAMMNYNYFTAGYDDLPSDAEKVAYNQLQGLEYDDCARYWLGYQVFLRPLLTFMTYSQIRILNYVLFSFLIGVLAFLIPEFGIRKAEIRD